MKKYVNHFISLSIMIVFLIMAWACNQNSYPSPDPWPVECGAFTPFTVQYEVIFERTEENYPGSSPVPNALITCQVIKLSSLPHPFITDTCYFTQTVVTILTGLTASNGKLVKNFDITYGSESDYFILEIVTEKAGYNRDLISYDKRYFGYNNEWVKSSQNLGPNKRYIFQVNRINAKNINP
jgi:hypothetical protein